MVFTNIGTTKVINLDYVLLLCKYYWGYLRNIYRKAYLYQRHNWKSFSQNTVSTTQGILNTADKSCKQASSLAVRSATAHCILLSQKNGTVKKSTERIFHLWIWAAIHCDEINLIRIYLPLSELKILRYHVHPWTWHRCMKRRTHCNISLLQIKVHDIWPCPPLNLHRAPKCSGSRSNIIHPPTNLKVTETDLFVVSPIDGRSCQKSCVSWPRNELNILLRFIYLPTDALVSCLKKNEITLPVPVTVTNWRDNNYSVKQTSRFRGTVRSICDVTCRCGVAS